MMVIVEHPKAKAEVRHHFDYYFEKSVVAAENFDSSYREGLNWIAQYPEINPIAVPGKRWRRLKKFPYKIIFEHDSSTIFILAVTHESQRPLYWEDRKFD